MVTSRDVDTCSLSSYKLSIYGLCLNDFPFHNFPGMLRIVKFRAFSFAKNTFTHRMGGWFHKRHWFSPNADQECHSFHEPDQFSGEGSMGTFDGVLAVFRDFLHFALFICRGTYNSINSLLNFWFLSRAGINRLFLCSVSLFRILKRSYDIISVEK